MADNVPSRNNLFKDIAKRASIKDVISFELGANNVISKGKDYVCKCPFHDDHSPSMQISVSRNTFKCWVDGEGGDPISFVEKYEHVSPMEALKKVCSICSIPLPDEIANAREYVSPVEQNFKDELNALLELKKFYQLSLSTNEGKVARDYLEGRKIPKESISHFGIGFAPSDPSLAIQGLRKAGYSVETLERAGILGSSSQLKDRYSSRIMYPIEDDWGHLVGFSGRRISDDQPGGKYINYPATGLFNKSQILYHYSVARNVARKYGYVYVVEGFNDVIAFQRAGIEACVGSMGTALTRENIQSLKRLGVEIRLCLDKDEAGQTAMEECLPLLLEAGVSFRVVRPFKGGKDADEVLANFYPNGNEELNQEANRFYDPFLFLLARALKKNGNTKKLNDSTAIQEFLKVSAPYFQALNPVAQEKDLEALSGVTEMQQDVLRRILMGQKVSSPTKEEPKKTEKKPWSKPYNKSTWNKETEEKNLVVSQNLPQNFHFCSNISEFIEMAVRSRQASMLLPQLVSNEAQLIYVLPKSREAFDVFNNSHVDIQFRPFYTLNLMISYVFEANSMLKEIGQPELDFMAAQLLNPTSADVSDDQTAEEDEFGMTDDDFGMDEDQTISMDFHIHAEDVPFLQFAIRSLSLKAKDVYKKENFEAQIIVHRQLIDYSEKLAKAKLDGTENSSELKIMKKKLELKGVSFKK